MVKVKVAKLEDADVGRKGKKRELYAMVAYYYPQYTFVEASKLKARDLLLLIKTAQKMKAVEYLNLTQIVAAPHSSKGAAVKKCIERYKDLAKD